MNYKEITSENRKVLREFGYVSLTFAEIEGRQVYLNECQVRAYQIMAKRAAEESDEAFNEFCQNVKIYSGRWKRRSTHIMTFGKDGRFTDEFDNNFFTANSKMALEIL